MIKICKICVPIQIKKMTLKGQNIHLRALEPEDLDFLYEIENNESIWEVSNTQTPYSKWVLKNYLENSHLDIYEAKQLRLAICQDEDFPAIGLIDLFDFDPRNNRAGIGIVIQKEENTVETHDFTVEQHTHKQIWEPITLSFDEVILDKVIEQIEDEYGIIIRTPNTAIRKCTLFGNFKNQRLPVIMDIICSSISATYQIEGNEIIILGDGCQ